MVLRGGTCILQLLRLNLSSSRLNSNYFRIKSHIRNFTRLTPNEVTKIIREGEESIEINLSSVKSYETNQLASNTPIEDTRAEGRSLLTTGMLFGVFDGHAGPACAQVIAKRLFSYVCASLLPKDVLASLRAKEPIDLDKLLLNPYNDRFDLVEDLRILYAKSLRTFVCDLAVKDFSSEFLMEPALQRAFLRLDTDISNEAQLGANEKTLSVAMSGAVACLAHVDGEHLHIASCGDCRAVLGTRSPTSDSEWIARPLTKDHNGENSIEVARILSEHPPQEKDNVLKNDRLLGLLAPLRAFGDCRFKWSKEEIDKYVKPLFGGEAWINGSFTPPYLTAIPEVTYHKLTPKDSFVILATDGLWDLLSPSQAVRLVGEHMSGKTVLSPFVPPEGPVRMGELNDTLAIRRESSKLKPMDENAATHLIRHALGGTEHGLDHKKISHLLTLPEEAARLFRDDITISVLFFDTEFLSQRPF